jgi:hypothetical protein
MKKIIIPIVIIVFLIVIGVIFYISQNREKPCSNCLKSNNSKQVTNIQEEEIVRNFFALIDEKRSNDAVFMMSEKINKDDSNKQAWAVNLNAINSIKVIKIEPSMKENWTDSNHTYKLTLDVSMNQNSAKAPIPYYGWDNGQNIRWVSIIKENNLWKIKELATGP